MSFLSFLSKIQYEEVLKRPNHLKSTIWRCNFCWSVNKMFVLEGLIFVRACYVECQINHFQKKEVGGRGQQLKGKILNNIFGTVELYKIMSVYLFFSAFVRTFCAHYITQFSIIGMLSVSHDVTHEAILWLVWAHIGHIFKNRKKSSLQFRALRPPRPIHSTPIVSYLFQCVQLFNSFSCAQLLLRHVFLLCIYFLIRISWLEVLYIQQIPKKIDIACNRLTP